MNRPAPPRAAQGGAILIEVLVASALLGLGLAAASGLMLQTLGQSSLNLHTGLAMQQALDLMECLQADPTACALQDTAQVAGQAFERKAELTPHAELDLTDIVVTVQWRAAGLPAGARLAQTSQASLQQVQLWGRIGTVAGWVGVSSGPASP